VLLENGVVIAVNHLDVAQKKSQTLPRNHFWPSSSRQFKDDNRN